MTAESKVGLKPCPFCGAAPQVVEEDSYGNKQIFCICEAAPGIIRSAPWKHEAAPLWNTRAALSEGK